MICKVIEHPADILRKNCKKVVDFNNDSLEALIKNMIDTTRYYSGCGLAAPQIGIDKRVIVVCTNQVMAMINPVILSVSDEQAALQEGCLSIPDFQQLVVRPKEVEVGYYDLKGDYLEVKASGAFSHIVQHEIDHLNGTLIFDYV